MVGSMVVHRDLFPDTVCHKGDRVLMPGSNPFQPYLTVSGRVIPVRPVNLLPGGSVIYLPVFKAIGSVIDGKLLLKEIFHQINIQRITCSGYRLCDQKSLLQFVHVLFCPVIMVTDDADGRIDAVSCIQNLIGKHRSIAVTDNIGSPFLRHFKRQFFISGFPGKGKAPFCCAHIWSPLYLWITCFTCL